MSDELDSLTVAQLKERLKAAGLTVSGKKADLIDRLRNTSPEDKGLDDASVAVVPPRKKDKLLDGDGGSLPFFMALAKGGISAVRIEKKEAIQKSCAVLLLILLIVGLGSSSWYSITAKDGDEEGVFNFSFDEAEIELEGFDEDMGLSITLQLSDCHEDFDDFDCEKIKTAGESMRAASILGIVVITFWILLLVANGFGLLSHVPILEEKLSLLDRWSLHLSVAIVGIGIFVYWLLAWATNEMEEEYNGDLGSMWWLTFLVWLALLLESYGGPARRLAIDKFQQWKA